MMTSNYALYLLSTPRVEHNGVRIKFDTQKAIALFAYLAITRQNQPRAKLATLIWPESDEAHAQSALRRTLSSLKTALAGDVLVIKRDTVSVAPHASLWLDVDAVRECLERPRTHDHPASDLCDECLQALLTGVDLYQNDVILGHVESEMLDVWLRPLADSLRAVLTRALELLTTSYCARGEFEQALAFAERWLALDPLQEDAHRWLLSLHAWSGHRTMALRHYAHLVRYLDRELGIPPQVETTQLYATIKANELPPPLLSLHIKRKPADDAPVQRLTSLPFISRTTEWEALNTAYSAAAKDGQVVAVEGEGGIGKTRLVDEFAQSTRQHGAITITMRCYEGEMNLAYAPLMAVLRGALSQPQQRAQLAAMPAMRLSEVARLVPELAELHTDLPLASPLDSPGAQTRFFECICQALYAIGAGTLPTLITCDDAQWADSASLDVLAYLVRRLGEHHLCLILTWRRAEVTADHPLHRLLREAQRSRRGLHLSLNRLNRAEVRELVRTADVGVPERADELAERLFQESEGLPILLAEYLMALRQGTITLDQHDWPLAGSMRDLLLARLAPLNTISRQMLTAAAVIGRSVEFDLLCEMIEQNEDKAITGLEMLLAHGVFVESHRDTSALTYDFSHDKLRAIVYNESSLARRRLLHRRIAEILVIRSHAQTESDELASQIAAHFQRAGDGTKAAQFFFQAGCHARKVYAHSAALAHFRTALTLGYADVYAAYVASGDVQTLHGDYAAALESYANADTCCPQDQRTDLAYKRAIVRMRQGEWERAQRQIEVALLHVEATNTAAVPRLYAVLSLLLYYQGQPEAAATMAHQAQQQAEALSDRHTLAQTNNLLGILATEQHDITTAQEYCTVSLALAEQLDDADLLIATLNASGRLAAATGNTDHAIALTTRALTLCDAQGDRHHAAALHSNLADLLKEADRLNEAIAHLKLAVSIFYEIGIESGEVQHQIWRLSTW